MEKDPGFSLQSGHYTPAVCPAFVMFLWCYTGACNLTFTGELLSEGRLTNNLSTYLPQSLLKCHTLEITLGARRKTTALSWKTTGKNSDRKKTEMDGENGVVTSR